MHRSTGPASSATFLGISASSAALASSATWAARLAFVALLALGLSGCAFSDSSESISDSVGSFSDSSGSFSDSSTSSSDDDTAYREDVQTYTVAHLRAGGTPETLRLGLSEVALARGIADWEAFRATFVAVGSGLAEAGASSEQVAAYRRALARPGSPNDAAIAEGLASSPR